MLGFEFDNNSEPFLVYKGFQALSCVVFLFIDVVIDTHTEYIIYAVVCGVLAMGCCACSAFFEFRSERKSIRAPRRLDTSRDSDVKGLLDPNSTF